MGNPIRLIQLGLTWDEQRKPLGVSNAGRKNALVPRSSDLAPRKSAGSFAKVGWFAPGDLTVRYGKWWLNGG